MKKKKKANGKKKRDKDDVALDTFAGHIEFLGIKVHNFGGNTIEPGCEFDLDAIKDNFIAAVGDSVPAIAALGGGKKYLGASNSEAQHHTTVTAVSKATTTMKSRRTTVTMKWS